MSSMDLVMMNRQLTDNPLFVYNGNGDRIDISSQPVMEMPNLLDEVGSDLLNRSNDKIFGRYMFNGVRVPRTSTILEYCSGNREYLMKWAAKLGDKYDSEKVKSLDTGTKAHEVIAEYLTSGTMYTLNRVRSNKQEVMNSVDNFIAWYNNATIVLGWKVELIISEVPLICPWFGGTADAILEINGKRYLVDFKTSKRMVPEYFIQVSAYKWIIDNFYPEYGPIDGVGILRFDKFSKTYEDLFLEMCNSFDAYYIMHCQKVFALAVNMFYSMNVLTNETSEIKKNKKEESNTGNIADGIKQAPVQNKRAILKKKGEQKHVKRKKAN